MAYKVSTVTGHYEFVDLIRRFACGYATWTTPGYSGTGNGSLEDIDSYPSTPSETWTITCTAAAIDGGTFSVTGSVSGAQAAATVGTPYDNGIIQFTITDGATDFAVNDEFTLVMTEGELTTAGTAWVEERYDNTTLNGEGQANIELILRGEGLSGTEQIWVAITTYQSANSDYYNISLSSMIGYVPGNALSAQPGWSGNRWIPMWNQSIPYWLVVNAQRIAFGAKVETHYVSGYAGKYFSYYTPGQFPYPICVGGTTAGSTTRYSAAYDIDLFAGIKVRDFSGSWITVNMYPYNIPSVSNPYYSILPTVQVRDTGGDYPLLPLSLYATSNGMVGDLDGCFYTSGFNSAVENVVQADATDHVKIARNQGTGFADYFALRLS